MKHCAIDDQVLRLPARLQSLVAAIIALILFAVMAATLAFAQTGGSNGFGSGFDSNFNEPVDNDSGESGGIRFREGTKLVGKIGFFRVQGDQVTFHIAEQEHSFVGLANLNLERVARAITDEASQLEWSVTGVVTEYRGANFLLVERAILKTKNVRGQRRD